MSTIVQKTPARGRLYGGGLAVLAFIGAGCSQGPEAVAIEKPESSSAKTSVAQSTANALCATAEEALLVREYYSETRPGAPLPIPGRKFDWPESKIASGLRAENALGIAGTPELLAEVWKTVDAWGADTPVRVVVSIDGWHPFDFPSKVPVTQDKHNQGFYDVYADNGAGVHIHLSPDDVKLIYAAQLPAPDGTAGRSVNLYDSNGRLIIGVYASSGGKPENEAAVKGFEGTWKLLQSLPRVCELKDIEG